MKTLEQKRKAILAHIAKHPIRQREIAKKIGASDAMISHALKPRSLEAICDSIIEFLGVDI